MNTEFAPPCSVRIYVMPPEDALAIAEKLLFLIAGLSLTLIGMVVKARADRRTYSSNRLFELRIEALNGIWQAFNEMKGLFAFRIEVGFPQWKEKYATQADARLHTFRRSIDNAQVVLPSEVIDILRQIDEEYFLYSSDDLQMVSQFQGKINKLVDDLTVALNKTMAKQIHEFNLTLRT